MWQIFPGQRDFVTASALAQPKQLKLKSKKISEAIFKIKEKKRLKIKNPKSGRLPTMQIVRVNCEGGGRQYIKEEGKKS